MKDFLLNSTRQIIRTNFLFFHKKYFKMWERKNANDFTIVSMLFFVSMLHWMQYTVIENKIYVLTVNQSIDPSVIRIFTNLYMRNIG